MFDVPKQIKTRMVVKLSPQVWDELKLDDPEMYARVRDAFYVGYGMESIRRLTELKSDHFEVRELARVAPLLGATKHDRLTKRQTFVVRRTGVRLADRCLSSRIALRYLR